jgi:hypothetical protein
VVRGSKAQPEDFDTMTAADRQEWLLLQIAKNVQQVRNIVVWWWWLSWIGGVVFALAVVLTTGEP